MKRSPLKRKTGLARRAFNKLATGQELKRTPLKRTGSLARTARQTGDAEVMARGAFNQAVLIVRTLRGWRRVECLMCDKTAEHAHHVIPKQKLRGLARSAGLNEAETLLLVYDPDDGVALCAGCHAAHENASRRVWREYLPPEAFEFAEKHYFTPYIERTYPLKHQARAGGGEEK